MRRASYLIQYIPAFIVQPLSQFRKTTGIEVCKTTREGGRVVQFGRYDLPARANPADLLVPFEKHLKIERRCRSGHGADVKLGLAIRFGLEDDGGKWGFLCLHPCSHDGRPIDGIDHRHTGGRVGALHGSRDGRNDLEVV